MNVFFSSHSLCECRIYSQSSFSSLNNKRYLLVLSFSLFWLFAFGFFFAFSSYVKSYLVCFLFIFVFSIFFVSLLNLFACFYLVQCEYVCIITEPIRYIRIEWRKRIIVNISGKDKTSTWYKQIYINIDTTTDN